MENDKLRATPAARNLAKKLGVDLFKVQGSGAKGRVHKEDVEIFNYEKNFYHCSDGCSGNHHRQRPRIQSRS